MFYSFDGAYALPGITADKETFENAFWFGRYENQAWASAVISGASRDTGNSTTTILRTGLALGKVTSTGKVKEWNPTGTDGSQFLLGFLNLGVQTQNLGSNQDRFMGHIMIGGTVQAARLLIPGASSLGISAATYEHLLRAQMAGRFLTDDKYYPNFHGGFRHVQAKTADYTVTEADNSTIFTNRGAAGTVVFTLPTTPKIGLHYSFHVVADQTVTVAGGTADNIVALNNATADSVGFATSSAKIGGSFEVFADGTGWLFQPHNWASAADASQITTVTDS